jgi:hypothetical protein
MASFGKTMLRSGGIQEKKSMGQTPEQPSKSRWIKLYPGIFYNDALDGPYCEVAAWLWLIMQASSNSYKGLHRGELRAAQHGMAKIWGWSRPKVQRFLKKLVKAGMIKIADTATDHSLDPSIDHRTAHITICNYSRYQDTLATPDQTSDHKPDHSTDHINKEVITKKEVKQTRASVCAADWRPADEMEMMVIASTEGVDYDQQLMRFRDYCQANGKAYKDHDAALRNWLRSPYNKRTTTNEAQPHTERTRHRRATLTSIFSGQLQDDGVQTPVPAKRISGGS